MARQPPPKAEPAPLTMDDLLSSSPKAARLGGSSTANTGPSGDDIPRASGGRMRIENVAPPGSRPNRSGVPGEPASMDELFGPRSAERARARATAPGSSADDLVGGKQSATDRNQRVESSLDDLFGPSKRR